MDGVFISIVILSLFVSSYLSKIVFYCGLIFPLSYSLLLLSYYGLFCYLLLFYCYVIIFHFSCYLIYFLFTAFVILFLSFCYLVLHYLITLFLSFIILLSCPTLFYYFFYLSLLSLSYCYYSHLIRSYFYHYLFYLSLPILLSFFSDLYFLFIVPRFCKENFCVQSAPPRRRLYSAMEVLHRNPPVSVPPPSLRF